MIVKDPRPSIVYVCVLAVSVIPEISVMLQKTLQAVLVVHVGVFVAPVQFTPPMRGISCVITILHAVIEFASKIAVSCGSGTRHGVAPPEVVNQFEADQLTLTAVFIY